ncbi:MAG: hypothetical protein WCQ67_00190 [Treponema sp.]
MGKIKNAVESVKKFVAEKGKFPFILAAILVFLFIGAVVASIIQCASKPKKITPFETTEPYISTKDLVPPNSEFGSIDYYFSRIPSDKWSEKEVDRWFTEPTQKEIDELGNANDAIISEITGAAP